MDVRAVRQFRHRFVVEEAACAHVGVGRVQLGEISVRVGVDDGVHVRHFVVLLQCLNTRLRKG